MTGIGSRRSWVLGAAGLVVAVVLRAPSPTAAAPADRHIEPDCVAERAWSRGRECDGHSATRPPVTGQYVDTSERVDNGSVIVDSVDGALAFPLPITAIDPHRVLAPHHDYPAVDLPVPIGTPVFAPASGVVSVVTTTALTWYEPRGGTCDPALGPCDRCGIGVRLRDEHGWEWSLCHLDTTGLSVGDRVAAGDVVGLSGNSGHSSGPHLHVGLRRPDGVAVCPQVVLAAVQVAAMPPPFASVPDNGCTASKLPEPI